MNQGCTASRGSPPDYAIAMAYVESAVVVYLRAIYYPQGFAFPLAPM
jgi:hypothetical protein